MKRVGVDIIDIGGESSRRGDEPVTLKEEMLRVLISAGLNDQNMLAIVAKLRVPVVLMHMRGTPQTTAGINEYDDVVAEVGKC
ncbi:hypothetical protein PHYSODRAFT_325024 [Phytophthora sojae]|uniref:Pterin-binding domain-containing protein n=1 Tax=Phytophthora sojae (strain P6497) TaxID=1094619 RepID=G4YXI5_PHYSP|nr:hypothetical protein PHYSODRAFT_325024 [Phytophthora sojae]EGZ23846.1 hypothetical protein PHYSODRAFT_325024 [Phytophthora sojae]|eukprot:XP_009519134.1 hypothetical protein PHYSODRAFT_325024 [Phytophthora sojae]